MIPVPSTRQGRSATGLAVDHPKAQGYNLRIGSNWYRTVASREVPIQIGTRDSLAERQDRAGSIYENVLDIGYAWSRTDLSGGEGLDWDPREMAIYQDQAGLDKLRFFESNGLDVARPDGNGEQYKLRLSHDTKEWAPVFVAPVDLATSSTNIYVADGELVIEYESWENTAPSNTWTPKVDEDIYAMAVSPNGTIMVTASNGDAYVKGPLESSFSMFYGDNGVKLIARGLWFVHGRFIMSAWDAIDNATLYEVNWDGGGGSWVETIIDTASSPFWSVVESGPAVVSACGDGTVRTYTPDNSQGGAYELTPRGRTTMPEGETPILLGSNSGVLLILTTSDTDTTFFDGVTTTDLASTRIYQAEVLDDRFDYIVGQLQLRRTWTTTVHEGLETRNMNSSRDEIWWFVRELIDGALSEALWRMDIVTNGMSRTVTIPDRNLNGLIIFDSIFGGIDFDNNKVVISDRDQYVDTGWMVFPNMTFGLNTDITWMASVLEVASLAQTGAQVELWRTSHHEAILDWQDPSWVLVQRISNPGGTNLELPMLGVKSRTLALQLRVFNHTGGTETPEVTRVAMRGIPAHRDLIMMVPVNISDYVSVPGRVPLKVSGLGNKIHEKILDLVGDNVQATLIDPPILFEGVVNNVSEPVEYLAQRGSVTRYITVEFRGQRTRFTSSSIGDAGIGLGLLGISTVGIGQTVRT